jgi:polar amino acid transport system substrate-binding protein
MKRLSFFFFAAIFSFASVAQESLEPVIVVTGGFEAIDALRTGNPIEGPRTNEVKAYLDKIGVPYEIQTTLWSRALNRMLKEPRTLIYPLTRTPEREDEYDWIQQIGATTFRLLSTKEIAAKNLSKTEIISGKYLAMCEATTVNCRMLRNFGFPDEAIVPVKGRLTQDLIGLVVNGRASFIMDDPKFIKQNIDLSLFEQISVIGDYAVMHREYLAGYKTDPALMKILTGRN